MSRLSRTGAVALCGLVPHLAWGQSPPLVVPRESPAASLSQTIGLTTIAIAYHRPAVKNRKIWGDLVPYGQVWRAGANENTILAFTSPVTIGGRAIAAGRYGLFMIPTETTWTVILSRESSAWGSFSYDPKEDALRVTVTPRPADFQERLAYTLDDPTDHSAVATLRWENLAVPITIETDWKAVVVDSLRQQMRGLPRFFWQGWSAAANWCLQNEVNVEEALAWSDNALAIQENFTTLRVKALALEQMGDTAQATSLRDRALEVANEVDVNNLGYLLLGEGKTAQAIELFKKNVKDHPASWNTYDSLGEAYALAGDKKLAVTNYTKALNLVKDEGQKRRIQGILAGLNQS